MSPRVPRPRLDYAQQVAVDTSQSTPSSLDRLPVVDFRSENRSLTAYVCGLHTHVRTDPTHQTSAKRAALLMRILTARPQEIDEMDLP